MKRIVTVQDISCVGKCSLTVALPLLSAMGIETAVIPTAVLSTHTAFHNFTFKDLADQILPIAEHWQKENLTFDAIYTGYLGTIRQIDIVAALFQKLDTKNSIFFVDPAMADNGKLYPTFDMEFVARMKWLCGKADIIVPNITEAALLTGVPYKTTYNTEYIQLLLQELATLGSKQIVITGVSFEADEIGVAGINTENGKSFYYSTKKVGVMQHGTGDIFASVCLGGLMRGKALEQAAALAADYIAQTIRVTMQDPDRRFYGVNFEQTIPYLIEQMK